MNHTFPSTDPLRVVYPDEPCENCGITRGEWANHDNPPCTGNAYICRVARKLLARNSIQWVWLGRTDAAGNPIRIEPWEMTADDLAAVVRRQVDEWNCYRGVLPILKDLLAAILANPAVCPVLSDALEEAGCTDATLLETLRTP